MPKPISTPLIPSYKKTYIRLDLGNPKAKTGMNPTRHPIIENCPKASPHSRELGDVLALSLWSGQTLSQTGVLGGAEHGLAWPMYFLLSGNRYNQTTGEVSRHVTSIVPTTGTSY